MWLVSVCQCQCHLGSIQISYHIRIISYHHIYLNFATSHKVTKRQRTKAKGKPDRRPIVPYDGGDSGSGSDAGASEHDDENTDGTDGADILADALRDGERGADEDGLLYPPEAEPDLRPIVEVKSGKYYYYAAEPPHEYLGRLSFIKEGTPQEAYAVYCARHGCNLMHKVHRLPSMEAVREWFWKGQGMERGRGPVLQAAHKRLWDPPL